MFKFYVVLLKMSFLKITDPNKRDFIVNEYLKTKRNIYQNSIDDKLGDIGLQRDLTKLYKPITDSQAGLATQLSAIQAATNDNTTALKALPSSLKAITFPQYPSIEAYEDPVESVRTLELGDIATEYLQKYASNKKSVDTTFGIYSKNGQFYIGTSPITIQGDDVTVGDKTYSGSPGLWELLTMANPDKSIYTPEDLENYAEILTKTKAIERTDNPNKPRSSRSDKYKEIIMPIWSSIKERSKLPIAKKGKKSKTVEGEGVSTQAPIILPSDPNALVEMLSLRIAAAKAGNTGAANEAVAICDELKRMGVLDENSYKSIMLQLS
jgi:hypothetical protein